MHMPQFSAKHCRVVKRLELFEDHFESIQGSNLHAAMVVNAVSCSLSTFQTRNFNDERGQFWMAINDWLNENCTAPFYQRRSENIMIYFASKKDLTKFLLTWGGS